RFDHVWNVALVKLRIMIHHFLFAKFLVVPEIEVGPRVDTFYLFESDGEIVFYVERRVCIMRQLHLLMNMVFAGRNAQAHVPPHPFLFPELVPFLLCTGPDKKLHFHLFELTHPENELSCNNFVTECLAHLRNSKRYLHTSRFLNVQEVYKNS